MTEENKKTILKLIKEKLEDARVTVRSHRQQVEKNIDAAEFSKDDTFRYKEEMQKLVDETNKSLEEIYDRKEEMLMTI